MFFNGSHYDSEAYDAIVQQLLKLQKKWDIGVLDLWTNEAFNNISDADGLLYMNDDIHPQRPDTAADRAGAGKAVAGLFE